MIEASAPICLSLATTLFYWACFEIRRVNFNCVLSCSLFVRYDTKPRVFLIDLWLTRVVNCPENWSFLPYQPKARYKNRIFYLQGLWVLVVFTGKTETVRFIVFLFLALFLSRLFPRCSSATRLAIDYHLHFNQWNQIALLTLIIYIDRCRMHGPNNSFYHIHACRNILFFEAVSIS